VDFVRSCDLPIIKKDMRKSSSWWEIVRQLPPSVVLSGSESDAFFRNSAQKVSIPPQTDCSSHSTTPNSYVKNVTRTTVRPYCSCDNG